MDNLTLIFYSLYVLGVLYFAVPWLYCQICKFSLIRKARQNNALLLTFDDGPGSKITPLILDKLSEANIKATFFILGSKIRAREDIVKRIVQDGHDICSHGYAHHNHWVVSPLKAIKDMHKGWAAVTNLISDSDFCYSFRPPHGKLTLVTLLYLLLRKIPICMWTAVPGNTYSNNIAKIKKSALKAVKGGGAICVIHDFDRRDNFRNNMIISLVDEIINAGLKNEMKFMTWSEFSKANEQ